MSADAGAVSEDAVLGGRLILTQPLRGHRVGHDAILLAAAVDAQSGQHAVDLGAGVGASGLALAWRIEGVAVALVEIDPALAALARDNAERNSLADRVRVVCLDVASSADAFASAGLSPGSADCVLMNPPFNDGQNPSPHRGRRLAHVAQRGTLSRWIDTAARLLGADGVITLIWRADGLGDVLAALADGFGAVSVRPVYPKPGATAIRVLTRAVKASRAPLSLLPGLLLAGSDGKPSPQAEAILRGGTALSLLAS
jgi:tRNA1(Val) A37 N6-methylase TrmN6